MGYVGGDGGKSVSQVGWPKRAKVQSHSPERDLHLSCHSHPSVVHRPHLDLSLPLDPFPPERHLVKLLALAPSWPKSEIVVLLSARLLREPLLFFLADNAVHVIVVRVRDHSAVVRAREHGLGRGRGREEKLLESVGEVGVEAGLRVRKQEAVSVNAREVNRKGVDEERTTLACPRREANMSSR